MYNADGVGLAAPQVGLSIRLLVIDADVMGDDFPECKGFKRAMVNPDIVESSEEEISMEEGCLSLPGVHEKVSRASKIRVKYFDENWEEHDEGGRWFCCPCGTARMRASGRSRVHRQCFGYPSPVE